MDPRTRLGRYRLANIHTMMEAANSIDTEVRVRNQNATLNAIHSMFSGSDCFRYHSEVLMLNLTIWCSAFNELTRRFQDSTGCHRIGDIAKCICIMVLASNLRTRQFGIACVNSISSSLILEHHIVPSCSIDSDFEASWSIWIPSLNCMMLSICPLDYNIYRVPSRYVRVHHSILLKLRSQHMFGTSNQNLCVFLDPVYNVFNERALPPNYTSLGFQSYCIDAVNMCFIRPS